MATVLEQETFIATNGKRYTKTQDGKCKVVKSFKELPMIVDTSEFTKTASEQLLAIYHFLKDKDDTTARKKNHISCRDYNMNFGEDGFNLYDGRNFNRKVKAFDSPFPSPEEVWAFISKPTINKDQNEDAKVVAKKVAKALVKKQVVEVVKEEKVVIDKDYLEKQRNKMIRMVKASTKVDNIIEKLDEAIPHRSFNVFYGKLKRKYEKKEIRGKVFINKVLELLKSISFEEKLKPAPKFTGLNFWNINELTATEDKVSMLINDKTRYEVTKGEFLAYFLLDEEPKCMPQLMKLCKGEITIKDFIVEPIKKDIFVAFDSKLLKQASKEVYEAIAEVLYDWEIHNPINYVYRNECDLKKGEKVRVMYLDWATRFVGTVCDTTSGIEVRYEDGQVITLMKHQQWQRVSVEKNEGK